MWDWPILDNFFLVTPRGSMLYEIIPPSSSLTRNPVYKIYIKVLARFFFSLHDKYIIWNYSFPSLDDEQYDVLVKSEITIKISESPQSGPFLVMICQDDPSIKNQPILMKNSQNFPLSVFDVKSEKSSSSIDVVIENANDGIYGSVLAKLIILDNEKQIIMKLNIPSKAISKLIF